LVRGRFAPSRPLRGIGSRSGLEAELGGAWLTKDFFFASPGKFCLIISAGRQAIAGWPQQFEKIIVLI
jgi:hypothetical protein